MWRENEGRDEEYKKHGRVRGREGSALQQADRKSDAAVGRCASVEPQRGGDGEKGQGQSITRCGAECCVGRSLKCGSRLSRFGDARQRVSRSPGARN